MNDDDDAIDISIAGVVRAALLLAVVKSCSATVSDTCQQICHLLVELASTILDGFVLVTSRKLGNAYSSKLGRPACARARLRKCTQRGARPLGCLLKFRSVGTVARLHAV